MPFRQVHKRERTKMEPQDRIVVFLAEFDYQVQQINSMYNFRKIIAGYIEH